MPQTPPIFSNSNLAPPAPTNHRRPPLSSSAATNESDDAAQAHGLNFPPKSVKNHPPIVPETMLKFPSFLGGINNARKRDGSSSSSSKFIVSMTECSAIDGADLIPVECGGQLVSHSVSLNDLGKQLLKAASEGNVSETKLLLSRGALFTADWLGTSPLHVAARHNHLDICQILLNGGILKDARTKVDKTSLHIAAFEGHHDIVELLLEYGADPDCRDLLNMTPLHWAAQNGHRDVIRTLLKYSAQCNIVSKFGLTPADLALQINRNDIYDLINDYAEGMTIGCDQHLTLELVENSNESEDMQAVNDIVSSSSNSPVPLETILMEEETQNSIDPEKLHITKGTIHNNVPTVVSDIITENHQDNTFAESFKLLREHGITMLPHEENNILTTVMESGHSVVLTDVGKQMLNSVKESEENAAFRLHSDILSQPHQTKNIITVSPEEFLAMASSCNTVSSNDIGKIVNTNGKSNNVLRQINGRLVQQKNLKRVVMKKNKLMPVTTTTNSSSAKGKFGSANNDMETVMSQLVEARKTIEEYKVKLMKKEQEAERYKQQLKLLMDES